MAFKGVLLAVGLAVLFYAALPAGASAERSTGLVMAFGIGSAYVITNLRKWKRHKEPVRDPGVGWAAGIILLIVCLASFRGVGAHSGPSGAGSAYAADPKETLLRDVKLDFTWNKKGFGNVMEASFTLKNPTPYRFKDFEIKCTHSAASGTNIDSNSKTIYQTIEPNSTKVIGGVNMGFINTQATQSSCELRDLSVLP